MDFRSDNTAAICPELFDAMARANTGQTSAYGADPWSIGLDVLFARFFDAPVRAFTVSTGTAANALAIATLCPPWGSVLCHRESHIERDECGAPEFFSGAKLTLLDGGGAKISVEALEAALRSFHPMVHMVQPRLLSLTQPTERGCLYSLGELKTLCDLAHAHGMKVHMDGARLANALVALDCTPHQLCVATGIDVLSFGASKNGGYACEAVVFFNPGLVGDFEYRRKRAGQLGCKARYAAAQWQTYLGSNVWARNARHANDCAAKIAVEAQHVLTTPPATNQLFLKLPQAAREALSAHGFLFYDWGDAGSDEIRLVTCWQTRAEDVEALCGALGRL